MEELTRSEGCRIRSLQSSTINLHHRPRTTCSPASRSKELGRRFSEKHYSQAARNDTPDTMRLLSMLSSSFPERLRDRQYAGEALRRVARTLWLEQCLLECRGTS